jgi:hypothetical protein
MSDLESQVAQIFGVRLGCVSEDEVVKHGEIAPPKVTPPAIKSDLAMAVKSKGETDGFKAIPLDQNQITCMPSTDIGKPSLSLACLPCQPTYVVRFAVYVSLPRQQISNLSLARARFALSFCVFTSRARAAPVCGQDHLECRPRRPEDCPCCSRRAAHHARSISLSFLLGLLASFRGVHGLYLVSVSLLFPVLCDI